LLWFFLFAVAAVFMLIHGIEYVSWPRLIPLSDIIYYNGPGFRSAHHGKGLGGKHEPSWKKTKWLSAGPARRGKVAVEEIELGTVKKD